MNALDFSTDVREAAERIRSGVQRTPTVRSRAFSAAIGGDVFVKIGEPADDGLL